jgi:hypothetical protein
MIKLTMNEQDFINLMTETAGGSEPDSYSETFTREGLQALFEHFYNLDYDFDKISSRFLMSSGNASSASTNILKLNVFILNLLKSSQLIHAH